LSVVRAAGRVTYYIIAGLFFFLVVVFDNIIQFKNKTKKLAGIFKKNLSPAIYIYLHAHILAPPLSVNVL
jgi:hypothetical protein